MSESSDIVLNDDGTLGLYGTEIHIARDKGSFVGPVVVMGELHFYNNVRVGAPRPPKPADTAGRERVQAELLRIGTSLDEIVGGIRLGGPPRLSPVEQLRRMEPPYNIYLMLSALRSAVLQLANSL